jgi:DNA-binding response OmpR family regulator
MPPAARILVVDDEPTLGALLVRLLQEQGYAAVATQDGRSQWAAAANAGQPFDLVVTNCSWAGLTGSQVLARLQHDYPGTPILHLEALQSPQPDLSSAHSVFSPFSSERFLTEVQRLLPGPLTQRSA